MQIRSQEGRIMFALLAFGVTGGSAFMFVKLLVGEISPLQIATGRVALGALPLLALMRFTHSTPDLSPRFILSVSVLAVIDTVVPYLLVGWSQRTIPSSTAALLVSTMPLFTTLLASRSAAERNLSRSPLLGLATGFAGVALLAAPTGTGFTFDSGAGMLAATAAAFCYAAGAVYSRTLLAGADALGLSAVKLTVATCLLLPLTLADGGLSAYATLSEQGWFALATVGLFSTGIGRCVYQWIIAKAGSVRASLVTYIVPVVSLLLGWLVLGESIGPRTAAGGLLIVGGVAAVMFGTQLHALGATAQSYLVKWSGTKRVGSVGSVEPRV